MYQSVLDFSMKDFCLDGKAAMITGANQGLGEVYAIALAKAGADIFIPHFTENIKEIKDIIEGMGRKVGFIQGDLTKDEDRKAAVQACMDMFGKIDILINNAGNNFRGPLLDFPPEKWWFVINLQLAAVHFLSQEVARIMKEQGGGKIINIASMLTFAADIGSTAYAVAKTGIAGMTRSYAADLGKYNITCNAIAPGFFETPLAAEFRAKNPEAAAKQRAKVREKTPMLTAETYGDIRDIMGLAVFLSSPASNYISGVVIPVDGGFTAQLF